MSEKSWYGRDVVSHTRKFSVAKYWNKPNAYDLVAVISDYIIGFGLPQYDYLNDEEADDDNTICDDLIFVEGGGGGWTAGSRIHGDEAELFVSGWVDFCLGDILAGFDKGKNGRHIAPAKTITVTVEKYEGMGGIGVRFTTEDLYRDVSMKLLPCLNDKFRLGGWTTVSSAKRTGVMGRHKNKSRRS